MTARSAGAQRPVPAAGFVGGANAPPARTLLDVLAGTATRFPTAPAVDDGETTLSYADFHNADEIFSTANFLKLAPVTRIDDRAMQPGPFYRRARELYWAYAHA